MQSAVDWRPVASLEMLRIRAILLARIRGYFARHGVLEVDTPVLSGAAATDPALHSFTTVYHGPGPRSGSTCYLQTSPEFPMKRLLAAGSGSIYQICKVFRDRESGRLHNPEFTLLEWYRTGYDHLELMDEVERLLCEILADIRPPSGVRHWTYRDLFIEYAGVDPLSVTATELQSLLRSRHDIDPVGLSVDELDPWLDLTLTRLIEPRLGPGLVFVRDYPASQAALARLNPGDPPLAARFEVYLDGIELANGFHELLDVDEQRQRFMSECGRRGEVEDIKVRIDERLLAALESGLPDCAGVALGLDRLLLVAGGKPGLHEVIAFPFDNA
ncbi:MAG TPA: EF-P lysine aminoacylase EpmA [Gammaproteobacteria bacterium]|nr:EF-P lysine aminoacylase EpmA [Gammaproteobacteria bacterium]